MSTHTEINIETGEVIEKPMTAAEVKSVADFVAESQAQRDEYAAKEAARISRREKLLALGLTEDELDA